MKKLLAALLATSSVVAFADSFQDFNNNLYAQYGLATVLNGSNAADVQVNRFGIGGTFQSKNNVWLNANMTQGNLVNGNVPTASGAFNLQAGYAFDMFGNDDSGLQLIPYASFGSVDNNNYAWGLGVQPEYRFLGQFKASLGLGLIGANGQDNGQSTTIFAFNVNPELQYDIAKTVLVSVGYNYSSQFNSNNTINANALNVKVGYLF